MQICHEEGEGGGGEEGKTQFYYLDGHRKFEIYYNTIPSGHCRDQFIIEYYWNMTSH